MTHYDNDPTAARHVNDDLTVENRDRTRTAGRDTEHHATTGGATGTGAVTGAVVGGAGAAIAEGATMGAAAGAVGGPLGAAGGAAVGAAIGAVGGAAVGFGAERAMHSDDDREGGRREGRRADEGPLVRESNTYGEGTPNTDMDQSGVRREPDRI